LAILPTGGGKTLTFQIPALIKAKAYKGLSVSKLTNTKLSLGELTNIYRFFIKSQLP
jgi:Rad3-related DNA helicase